MTFLLKLVIILITGRSSQPQDVFSRLSFSGLEAFPLFAMLKSLLARENLKIVPFRDYGEAASLLKSANHRRILGKFRRVLQGAEGILFVDLSCDAGLAFPEFVHHQIVHQDKEGGKTPAGLGGLAFEAQEVKEEIAVSLTFKILDFQFVGDTGILCLQTTAETGGEI